MFNVIWANKLYKISHRLIVYYTMSSILKFANGLKSMKKCLPYVQTLIISMIVATAVFVYDRKDALPMDLSEFQWKNRLLFLIAPDSNHPEFKKLQHDIARQPEEVKDRDLVIFEIFEQGESRINTAAVDRQTADSFRDRFGIAKNEFTLILVGKDGGVKLKRKGYVSLATVFELIDSMPMRQNEMRQRKQ